MRGAWLWGGSATCRKQFVPPSKPARAAQVVIRAVCSVGVPKRVRAEPVAARYEVDPPRAHHVGAFLALEDRLTVDAGVRQLPGLARRLVHGVTYPWSKESRRVVVASPLGPGAGKGRRLTPAASRSSGVA